MASHVGSPSFHHASLLQDFVEIVISSDFFLAVRFLVRLLEPRSLLPLFPFQL